MTDKKREEILTKAKPILFNTEMVKAILDGRKTTTRRVLKPYNSFRAKRSDYYQGNGLWCDKDITYIKDYSISCCWTETETYIKEYAPYKVGDILYVRETWRRIGGNYFYRADAEEIEITNLDGKTSTFGKADGLKWKPSIHMPKEAARIFLRVTDIRVERLQDCGNAQAKDEGCTCCSQFARIWNSTIKKSDLDKYGWDANPWVWVIELERID